MSETSSTAASGTSAASIVPVVQAAAPAIAPTATGTTAPPVAHAPELPIAEPEQGKEPPWLKERLERAQRALLRDIGADNKDVAKAAVERARKADDAEKSAEQRALETGTKLTAAEARAASLLAVVQSTEADEMGKLTPSQRDAVIKIAGDDPAQRLATIRALAPTWQVPAAQPTAPPPPPSSVSTAPAPGGPPPVAAAPQTLLEKYNALRATSPTAAAHFLRSNTAALTREMQAAQTPPR